MFCFQLPDISQHEITNRCKIFFFAGRLFVSLSFLGSPFVFNYYLLYMQGSGRKNRCSLIGRGLALLRAQAVLYTEMVSSHLNNS